LNRSPSRTAAIGDDVKLIRKLPRLESRGAQGCNSFLTGIAIYIEGQPQA
jgi:hypothetical protein